MSALALPERVVATPTGEPCPTCKTELVVKMDAIGRTRVRCPRCDRVSPARTVHPDEVLRPQTLAPVPLRPALPVVAPGQLRCQHCAQGTKGPARFCSAACKQAARDARRLAPCRRCRRPYVRTRAHSRICPSCATQPAAKERAVTTCMHCNAIYPRERGGRKLVMRCPQCPPKTSRCAGCGHVRVRVRGLRELVKRCPKCPRPPRRSHPTKPRSEWKAPVFAPKPCARCSTEFQPTGPRASYCPSCRT